MDPSALSEIEVAETYRRLGRRPASLAWAKAELALGLIAVALGVGLAVRGETSAAYCGLGLLACGAYLALAGHRTHLYDAMTRQLALSLRSRSG